MVQTISQMIYIGNLPIIDTNESDPATENAGAIAGTYFDSQMQMVDITNHDVDNDGVIFSDEIGTGDFVSYTLRDQPETVIGQDAIILYSARITEVDGTVHDVEISVIQMPNGDTFVNDFGAAGNTDNLFIDSIELIAPTSTGSAGRNTFATTSNTTICFVEGTMIDTPTGAVAIEDLRPGCLVTTLDHGAQPVVWRRRQSVVQPADQQPIIIPAGALGCELPRAVLRVSPQHRIMVNARVVMRMFGTDAVLIPAKRLVALPDIHQHPLPGQVDYWHILLAKHEIVFANGAPAETLWTGAQVAHALPAEMVHRADGQTTDSAARLIPSGPRQKNLISRLARNNQTCLHGFSGSVLHAGIGALARKNPPEAARFVQ